MVGVELSLYAVLGEIEGRKIIFEVQSLSGCKFNLQFSSRQRYLVNNIPERILCNKIVRKSLSIKEKNHN